MKRQLLAFVALGCCAQALADTRVPGTKVSYKVKVDALTGGNAGMVFVDAAEDASGKTYMALTCDLGEAKYQLYSKAALGTEPGERVPLFYRKDDGKLRLVEGVIREDTQTGKLSVAEFKNDSPQLFQTFITAKSKVVVRLGRTALSDLTLTFPVSGFKRAFQAIRSCE